MEQNNEAKHCEHNKRFKKGKGGRVNHNKGFNQEKGGRLNN